VPFNYSVIQFMNKKSNMTDASKSNMKDGLKMNKTVKMEFKNKHVAKSGKCIPKTLNGYETIEKRETFTTGFGNEGYIAFNTIEEVKSHFSLDTPEKYQLFRQKHNIIRNENGNVFTVFE